MWEDIREYMPYENREMDLAPCPALVCGLERGVCDRRKASMHRNLVVGTVGNYWACLL